jgi:hypothetical protein
MQPLSQLFVKKSRTMHHSSRLYQEKFLLTQTQAIYKVLHQSGELPRRELQQIARAMVAFIRSAGHHRKNLRKQFVRNRVHPRLKFLPILHSLFFQDFSSENRRGAGAIELTQFRNSSGLAHIVRASFVTQQRSVTADPHDLSVCIAPHCG